MNTDIVLDAEKLETAIDRLLAAMHAVDCDSDEYRKMADQLVKLYKAKETHVNLVLKEIETAQRRDDSVTANEVKEAEADVNRRAKELEIVQREKQAERPWLPSTDTLAIIGANLLGIVVIIGHERAHVITTKAFGLLSKMR